MKKHFLWVIACLTLASLVLAVKQTPGPPRFAFEGSEYFQLAKNPTRQGYWEYVVWIRTYDRRIVRIIECESQFNSRAKGDHGSKGFKAYGLAQFHQETFLAFAKKYGIEKPDWFSSLQQIDLAKKMVDDGYGKLWTCWDKIQK